MNAKILIVLLIGVSFLFFGCAAKQGGQVETPVDDMDELPDEVDEVPEAEDMGDEMDEVDEQDELEDETEEADETGDTEEMEETTPSNVSDEDLANLFEIDEDEPVGDTGLDGAQTPSSEKEQNTS